MKVYSYCSYEGSPCGFILGSFSFDANAKTDETIHLSKDGFMPLIQTALECGMIDFVFGNLPDPDTYWIVIKNLDSKDNKPFLYLNFAFETHDKEEYLTLLSGILHKYENIQGFTERLSRLIIPQNDNADFGLSIDGNALSAFWRECSNDSYYLSDFYKVEEQLFLFRKVLSDTANKNRSKELMEAFQLGKGFKILHNYEHHCHIAVRKSIIPKAIKNTVTKQMKKTYRDLLNNET